MKTQRSTPILEGNDTRSRVQWWNFWKKPDSFEVAVRQARVMTIVCSIASTVLAIQYSAIAMAGVSYNSSIRACGISGWLLAVSAYCLVWRWQRAFKMNFTGSRSLEACGTSFVMFAFTLTSLSLLVNTCVQIIKDNDFEFHNRWIPLYVIHCGLLFMFGFLQVRCSKISNSFCMLAHGKMTYFVAFQLLISLIGFLVFKVSGKKTTETPIQILLAILGFYQVLWFYIEYFIEHDHKFLSGDPSSTETYVVSDTEEVPDLSDDSDRDSRREDFSPKVLLENNLG